MDEKTLKALAAELAKGLKTQADLNQFSRMLTKLTVETALNAELTDHLGYEKNAPKKGSHTRNGYSSKTLLCDDGEIELSTPRDRENTFEPQLIKKNQTRITQMDSQILSLYAKGMTTREIVATFREMYDADVSPTLISKVTDAVKEQVTEWQSRPLDVLYPIVYLDCIVVKVRQSGSVINKSVFLALGINTEGRKELAGGVAGRKRRGEVLAECADRTEEPGTSGHPDSLRRLPERFSRCDKQCVSTDPHPALHYPYSTQQPEIPLVEGLQRHYQRVESGVSGSHRGSGADGAG